MSEIKKTAKYAAIYGVGVIMNRAVSFIMLPVYTRCLTPSDYGTLELLLMTLDAVAMFIGMGLTAGIFRFYFMHEDQKYRYRVISTVTILLIFSYLLGSSMGCIFAKRLSILIFDSTNNTYYFQLLFLSLLFQALIEIPLIFIRARQKAMFYVGISFGKLILQLILNIYFVVFLRMGVLGVLYSTLISSVTFGTGLVIYTFKEVGMHFSKKLAWAMILFGAPFIITNFADFILTFSDRYFLKTYATLAEVGIYSLGYKFGFLLWVLVVGPIFNIWDPQRFEIANNPDFNRVNQQVFLYANFLIILTALCISLFSRDLFRVMSAPDFWDAYKVIPLILIAYIIHMWSSFCVFGLLLKAKTKLNALITLISAICIIIFSFLLIPPFKIYGAGLATIAAFFIRFVLIFHFSQRQFRLELPWAKILTMLLISAIICIVSLSVQQEKLLISLCQNALLVIIFLVAMFIFPIFDTYDQKKILNILRHPIANFRKVSTDYSS